MLERIVLFVLRGLLLYGYTWFRRGSALLVILHMVAIAFLLGKPIALIVVLVAQLAIYGFAGMMRLAAYSLALASIPAVWMGTTQLVLDLIEVGGLAPSHYAEIALRSLAISLVALYLIHSVNPSEASAAAYKITGRCTAAYTPLLIHRMMGLGLLEASEALLVHGLKGASRWRTLGMLLFRSEEVSRMMEDGVTLRIDGCRPIAVYSARALAAQASLLVVDAILMMVPV